MILKGFWREICDGATIICSIGFYLKILALFCLYPTIIVKIHLDNASACIHVYATDNVQF